MTVIHGQIGTLKQIRKTLDGHGISRFNSTADINRFLKNFDNEREELFFKIERDFDLELDKMQAQGYDLQKDFDLLKTTAEANLKNYIRQLHTKCDVLRKPAKNAVMELLYWYGLQFLLLIKYILEKNFDRIVGLRARGSKKRLEVVLKAINGYSADRHALISTRCDDQFRKLLHMRSVATDLLPLIAGAIGEDMVVGELKKLSGNHVLINDFSIVFENPRYHKQTNSRIRSIQIDHLLINTAGIFIIETKNWSKASIASLDLWSPLQQVQRANFALYTMLHGHSTNMDRLLREHHWGTKKVPIRNILALIRHKPREKFSNVAVKTLQELNTYIGYHEPIFAPDEVHRIAEYLLSINNKGCFTFPAQS